MSNLKIRNIKKEIAWLEAEIRDLDDDIRELEERQAYLEDDRDKLMRIASFDESSPLVILAGKILEQDDMLISGADLTTLERSQDPSHEILEDDILDIINSHRTQLLEKGLI